MDRLKFSIAQGLLEIAAYVDMAGEDVLVLLTGGRPHIGAVGIAQVRSSLRDPQETSSTGSVFTLLGHKEDFIAKKMAEDLSKKLRRNVVVVAGMHWDDLREQDIHSVIRLCRKIEEEIAAALTI